MLVLRYIGVPRSVVNGVVGSSEEWRHLGQRILERAKATCPVSDSDEGTHLVDTLVLRMIGGEDPRMMIGSSEKGAVLSYVHDGTEDHFVAPVNAQALHWVEDGEDRFSKGHEVRGITPNPFILTAARAIVQAT